MAENGTFTRQLQRGKLFETFLDEHFAAKWDIYQIPTRFELMGMGDRVFIRQGEMLFVEYKTDERATATGNAFIETLSVVETNTPGWAYSCKADYIFYYLPNTPTIYVISPDVIRGNLPEWESCYRTAKTDSGLNDGYHSAGVLVPHHLLGPPLGKCIDAPAPPVQLSLF